jgi:hypothetical protein
MLIKQKKNYGTVKKQKLIENYVAEKLPISLTVGINWLMGN